MADPAAAAVEGSEDDTTLEDGFADLNVGSSTFDASDELYDQGEDDDDVEDLEDAMEINPDHPALQRVQIALKRQILAQKERLEGELRTKRGLLKGAVREREDTGVALYSAQQMLAKQQMLLESKEDERTKYEARKAAAEDALREARNLHHEITEKSAAVEKAVVKARREAQKLRDSARSTREKAAETESGLKVAMRQAKKASTVEENAEKEKQMQDLFVDRLLETVQQREDEIKILETKVAAQQDNTQAALARVNEAQSELDQLKIERREISQQWHASLQGLAKRSEMRSAMQEACSEEEQQVASKKNEIEAIKKQVREVQGESEIAELRRRRVETDLSALQRTVAETQRKTDAVKSDYSILTQTLKDSETKAQRAQMELNLLVSEDNALRQKIERASRKKNELAKLALAQSFNETTLTKAGAAMLKAIKKQQLTAGETEMRLNQVENKIAREQLRSQALETSLSADTQDRDAAVAALQARETALANLDVESRRNRVTIARQEENLSRLQRKINAIVAKREEDGAGNAESSPLELERDALRQRISSVTSENTQNQQLWLQRQHEYVTMMTEMDTQRDAMEELKTQTSVLLQKKLRLMRDIDSNTKELRRAKLDYSLLQNDITKLNTLINKNADAKEKLASVNETMELDFLAQLKSEELESIQLQSSIEEITAEKARLNQGVVDSEREILQWEKKIQLAQEMKATLAGDDESGNEVAAMKKEIHRMELRLTQLARQKEVLIQAMEQSVERRGDIHTKATASSKTKGAATQEKLKKQIVDLRKRVRQTQKDADGAEKAAVDTEREADETATATKQLQADHEMITDHVTDLTADVAAKRTQRQLNLERITYHQQLHKHITNALVKKKVFKKSAEQYEEELREQLNTLQNLNNVAEYVMEHNPESRPTFDPIVGFINRKLTQAASTA
eukprot:m.1472829 g.1472829  ORF g.1472829 m.1472829 type:complete len:924 (+) comp25150_c0_seq1:62-2833(+)